MNMRKQFTFYSSFWEAVQPQPEHIQNAFFRAVIQYALYEKEPNAADTDPTVLAMFGLTRPTLDSSLKKSKKSNRDSSGRFVKENSFTDFHHEGEGENYGEDEGEKEVEIEVENEKEIKKDSFFTGGAGAPKRDAIRVRTKENDFFFIYPSTVNQLKKNCPGLNVVQELIKLSQWCEANPGKRKPKKDILPFIYRWMERAEANMSAPSEPIPAVKSDVEQADWMRRVVERIRVEKQSRGEKEDVQKNGLAAKGF